MKEKIEEIVFLLLNSNKLRDKVLGMQLAKTFSKENKTEVRVERIKRKLYEKYLTMIDPDVARNLNNIDVLLDGVLRFIYEESFWWMDDYGNFHFNGQTLERTAEGYITNTATKRFYYGKYEQQFKAADELLKEKENILAVPPALKEGENEKLADLLREVITTDTIELQDTKRLYK